MILSRQPLLFLLADMFRSKHMPLGVPPWSQARVPTTVAPSVLTISGQTLDSAGAAKTNATVYLLDMTSGVPVLVQTTTSDASGNYSFSVGSGLRYWIVDYKAGAPDVAGATINTLTGV